MHGRKIRKWLLLLALLYVLGNAASIWTYGAKDESRPADAAIVLGAAAYPRYIRRGRKGKGR